VLALDSPEACIDYPGLILPRPVSIALAKYASYNLWINDPSFWTILSPFQNSVALQCKEESFVSRAKASG
jgi:hypothetical protein